MDQHSNLPPPNPMGDHRVTLPPIGKSYKAPDPAAEGVIPAERFLERPTGCAWPSPGSD